MHNYTSIYELFFNEICKDKKTIVYKICKNRLPSTVVVGATVMDGVVDVSGVVISRLKWKKHTYFIIIYAEQIILKVRFETVWVQFGKQLICFQLFSNGDQNVVLTRKHFKLSSQSKL